MAAAATTLGSTLIVSTIAVAKDEKPYQVEFLVKGPEAEALEQRLRNASAVLGSEAEEKTDPDELLAAARSEYSALLDALYAAGHFAPVIHVRVDGTEAASIPPLDIPQSVATIAVEVDVGPKFTFSTARVAPVSAGTELPPGFATGKTAESGLVRQAVRAGVDGWREAGHAKAEVNRQDVVADHRNQTLGADISLRPGPRLRFGRLIIEGEERMREGRIHKIAGLPDGEIFDPEALRRSAERLRRSGVFKSVTLTEADTIRNPDLLDITATVVEEKRRRYSIGAEISSFEGLDLTGYWLHRNLMGGAERLRVDGKIGNIGAQSSGVDYEIGATLERPATFTPDTTLSFTTRLAHLDEEDYRSDSATIGVGLSHYFSERLTARAGLEYTYSRVTDQFDTYYYRHLALPLGATWDMRDDKLDTLKGYYIDGEFRPFVGFGFTDSGARLTSDMRVFHSFGDTRPVTLAGRLQLGAIQGSTLLATPRDYLFYSGGGGTVRGQPYQALGVEVSRIYGDKIGGMAFASASGEVRARFTDTIGAVGFVDVGYISALDFGGDYGDWHAGAGVGIRYATGFGPIRLDVAMPVKGSVDTGDGVQIYVGIGQAF